MPPVETSDLQQDALYFEKVGQTRHNEIKVRPPVEIPVRWEWRQTRMLGPTGTPVAVDAQVVVDRDIVLGSLMWEGGEDAWYGREPGTSSGSAGDQTYMMQVVALEFTPDIKNRSVRMTVGLTYFRDRNATVV